MSFIRSIPRRFPIIFALASVVLIACLTQLGFFNFMATAFTPALGSVGAAAVANVIVAAIILVWALLFIGPHAFTFSSKGMGYGLKISLYFLVIMIAYGGVVLVMGAKEGAFNTGTILPALIASLVTCLCLGIFEEVSFRTCALGGLISKMGNTKTGVIWAVIISSLIFGFVHNLETIISATSVDFMLVLNIVLKTLQSGAAGVLFATVYLCTRNFWTALLVHGLGDFVAVLAGKLQSLSQTAADAASSGSSDGASVGLLLLIVFIILYIPIVIVCFRILLKKLETPCVGPFDKEFLPKNPLTVPQFQKNYGKDSGAKSNVASKR